MAPTYHHTALLNEAWLHLLEVPGVGNLNPSGLDCHPLATALVLEDIDLRPIALLVCVQCLTTYLRASDGGMYGAAPSTSQRVCRQCGTTAPVSEFVSNRTGSPTRFCADCRTAWGRNKYAERKKLAGDEVELEVEDDGPIDLAAIKADLLRLERELME